MTKGEMAAWEVMQLVQHEAMALIRAHPDMAKHVATGLLGVGCAFADAYGVDQLRYFFLREVSFGQDGNYSHDAIVGRINADLANDLGNLAQRSLSMIAKNCEGRVPPCGAPGRRARPP